MSKPYCTPWNTGLASETPAVARRLARLVESLDNEITSNVVSGEIVEDVHALAVTLRQKLDAEGWFFTYDGGDKLKCYPPDSKTGKAKRADMERRYAEATR